MIRLLLGRGISIGMGGGTECVKTLDLGRSRFRLIRIRLLYFSLYEVLDFAKITVALKITSFLYE